MRQFLSPFLKKKKIKLHKKNGNRFEINKKRKLRLRKAKLITQ